MRQQYLDYINKMQVNYGDQWGYLNLNIKYGRTYYIAIFTNGIFEGVIQWQRNGATQPTKKKIKELKTIELMYLYNAIKESYKDIN